jgi:hypothetical protein
MSDIEGMPWGKLYEKTFEGSMYGGGPVLFAVWCYAIAHMRPPNGVVKLNPRPLADTIGCSVAEVEKAIEILCGPDPASDSKAMDGRRLLRVSTYEYQGVNYIQYRNGRCPHDRQEQNRLAQARRREKLKSVIPDSQQESGLTLTVSPSRSRSNSEQYKPPHPPAGGASVDNFPSAADQRAAGKIRWNAIAKDEALRNFSRFWDAWPAHHRKVAKPQCWAKWKSRGCEEHAEAILTALEVAKVSMDWTKNGGEFIPAPLVWLNQQRWEAPQEAPNASARTTPPTESVAAYQARIKAEREAVSARATPPPQNILDMVRLATKKTEENVSAHSHHKNRS